MDRAVLIQIASQGALTVDALAVLAEQLDADVLEELRGAAMLGPEWSQQRWRVDAGARLLPLADDEGTVLGFGWWVPFGEGWEIPAGFEFGGEGPFDWKMWIHVLAGKAECVSLTCCHPEGKPITAASLRRLPLGRLVNEGVLMASRPADEIPKRRVLWSSAEAVKAARGQVAQTHKRRTRNPREQRPVTDDRLREVAKVYRDELAGGAPTKAVAVKLNYSRASAGRLVMEARARGFLPPTEPRRARG